MLKWIAGLNPIKAAFITFVLTLSVVIAIQNGVSLLVPLMAGIGGFVFVRLILHLTR